MKLYNSLSKEIEEFIPLNPSLVSMYTCGPTVYWNVTIANFRTLILGDFIYRILSFNGYKIRYIMNLTDVGHLSSDADEGDDKLERAAGTQGKTAREIADVYIASFFEDSKELNMTKPAKYTRATEYIEEQIDLVKDLEAKGYTYTTSDGVYFDTSKFESYGKLSGLTVDTVREGSRVEINPEKKNPTDFALWKLSPIDSHRYQEWESPWGVGFPGWHLECSAMSLNELGDTIDIHIGGEDLKMIHHQNEIAQSECSTGKEFVKYWVHGAFMNIDGGRMGKSLGNAYTLEDVEKRGFEPLALRYFYMTASYRTPLNFTWEALEAANNALKKIYDLVSTYKEDSKAQPSDRYLSLFREKISNDINLPEAIAVVWEMLKSDIEEGVKLATILKMDKVLGFKIDEAVGYTVPSEIMNLAKTREEYRKSGVWDKADVLRRQIKDAGYIVEDIPSGFKVKRI